MLHGLSTGSGPPVPYGLPCVRELFRFLMSLTNPLDRQNTDVMVHMGLSLLTVTLEAGADHISKFNSLLYLIKDDMCRNLFFVSESSSVSVLFIHRDCTKTALLHSTTLHWIMTNKQERKICLVLLQDLQNHAYLFSQKSQLPWLRLCK